MESKRLVIILVFLLVASILSIEALANNQGKQDKYDRYSSIENTIQKEGKARVIVLLKDGTPRNAISDNYIGNKKELSIIHGYAGTVDKAQFRNLKRLSDDGLIEIRQSRVYHIIDVSQATTQVIVGAESIGANYSRDVLGITGAGVTVAVIDTGIDYTHPDLGGCFNESNGTPCRVKGGEDVYNGGYDPMDDNGHGTHVAGIIGANGTIVGVAPGVSFLAYKVCDATGQICWDSDIIYGIQQAVTDGADVISISLGLSNSNFYNGTDSEANAGTDPLSIAVDNAVDAGVVVSAAAGNYGPGIGTVAVPAAAVKAITVGASDDQDTIGQDDDTVASFSCRGPSAFGRLDPDIVAPGVNIYSTVPTGGCAHCDPSGYETMSGTSMAAPFVTGAAALLLEQNPTADPAQIRAMLLGNAVNISGKLFDKGAGSLNVQDALSSGLYASVQAYNTYGILDDDDKWQFIAAINGTVFANVTIYNTNDYDVELNSTKSELENMENSLTLDDAQLQVPDSIMVPADGSYTFGINFTLENFSQVFATTYGGLIVLIGNSSYNLTIPVAITVPLKNYANIQRTALHSGDPDDNTFANGDVLYYAYYNAKSGNETYSISWSGALNDLDLYLHNITGGFDQASGTLANPESVTSTEQSLYKWVKVHAANFSAPLNFSLNITDNDNNAPIVNATDDMGTQLFEYPYTDNITLDFGFSDPDDDAITYELNDSRYNIDSQSAGSVVYILQADESLLGTHDVSFEATDEYGETTTRTVTVTVFSARIDDYSPSATDILVRQGTTVDFTTSSSGGSLEYNWYIDGTPNATTENLSLNTAGLNGDYNITFVVNDSLSSDSHYWNLTVDGASPAWVQTPMNISVDTATAVAVQYNATDNIALDSYFVNDTNNFIINHTGYFRNNTALVVGNYSVNISVNDSTNNVLSTIIRVEVRSIPVDTDGPTIMIYSPNTTYTVSFILVNFTATDASGVNKCWYSINGTNTSITCNSTELVYIGNGYYNITAYANDTNGYTGSAQKSFIINDTTNPVVSNGRPSGNQDPTDTVILNVTTDEYAHCRYATTNKSFDNMTINFTDSNAAHTSHTLNITVVEGDSYNIHARCADPSNNIGYLFYEFDIDEDTGGGGSGGGGGGGGASSSNITQTSAYRYSKFLDIASGSVTILIPSTNIPIWKIIIDLRTDKRNIELSVERIFQLPINQPVYPNTLYSYIDIRKTNLDPADIGMARIFFRIPRTWLDQSGIPAQNIQLYRLDNGVWTALTTNYVGITGDNYEYESITPGFSYFAIGGVATLPIETQPTENLNTTLNATVQQPATVPQVQDTTNEPTVVETKKNYVMVAAIAAILVGAVIFLLSMKFSRSPRSSGMKKTVSTDVTVEDIKKSYAFDGNQIVQEYHQELAKLSKSDPDYSQKVSALRDASNKKIAELQDKYRIRISELQAKK